MADEARLTSAGALVTTQDARARLTQVGVLVTVGDVVNARLTQVGVLATIGALGHPKLEGVADDENQITITTFPAQGATTHNLYRDTCLPVETTPANLIAEDTGAAPDPYVDSGLAEGETYYYAATATDGIDTTVSDTIAVHAPGFGFAPDLRVQQRAADGGVFEIINDDASVLNVRWQIHLATDVCFQTPVLTRDDAVPSTRAVWDLLGTLTTNVAYVLHVRNTNVDGNSDWTDLAFTPRNVAIPGGFTSPDNGATVSGDYVVLEWDLFESASGKGAFWRPTELLISTDGGETFATLSDSGFADATADAYNWDSTTVADGLVVFAVNAFNSESLQASQTPWLLLRVSNDESGCTHAGVANGEPIGPDNIDEVIVNGTGTFGYYTGSNPVGSGLVALVTTGNMYVGLPGTFDAPYEEFKALCIGHSATAGGLLAFFNGQGAEATLLGIDFVDGATGLVTMSLKIKWELLGTGFGSCPSDFYAGNGVVQLSGMGAADFQESIEVTGSHWFKLCGRDKIEAHGLWWEMTRSDPIGAPTVYDYVIHGTGWFDSVHRTGTVDLGVELCGFPVAHLERLSPFGGWLALHAFSVCGEEGDACGDLPGEIPEDFAIEAAVVCDCVTLTAPPFYSDSATLANWEVTLDDGYEDWDYPAVPDTGFQSTDLASHEFCDLAPGDYLGRVTFRFPDSSEQTSSSVAFTIQENTPPTAPVIETPTEGQTFTDGIVTLRFSPAVDLEGDYLEYEAAYSTDDGLSWIVFAELGTIDPDTDNVLDLSALPPGIVAIRVRAFDGCLFGPPDIVCIILDVICPEEVIHVTYIDRLELWSDLRDNGGERIGFIPDYITATDHRELQGEETFALTIPRVSDNNDAQGVWEKLRHKRVIRTVYADLTFEEWRIIHIQDERDDRNALSAKIECESPCYDLNTRQLRRTEVNGTVLHEWGLYGVTVLEAAQVIIAQAPRYFRLGHVDEAIADAIIDLDFSWNNVLEGLVQIQERYADENLTIERQCRRTCSGYNINLVVSTGATPSDPVASFTSETGYGYEEEPLVVLFDGSGSSAPSGTIISWDWDFGDGDTGTGEFAVHEFDYADTYTVTLTVTDNGGRTNSIQLEVELTEAPEEEGGSGGIGSHAIGSSPIGG